VLLLSAERAPDCQIWTDWRHSSHVLSIGRSQCGGGQDEEEVDGDDTAENEGGDKDWNALQI
jgi:hypothetical protein